MRLKRRPEKRDILIGAVLLLLIALLIWLGTEYSKTLGEISSGDWISSAQNLRQFILSYGHAGILIMTFLHALHVMLPLIPLVIVHFTGGMIFGLGTGLLTALIGVSLGTAVSFYLSRFLGKRFITLFVSAKNMKRLTYLLSSEMSAFVLLVLFMLPTPKDFFAYFIGLTDMKAAKFFLISFIGRLPGIFAATYLGAHFSEGHYILIGVVTALTCAVSLLLYVRKDKILARLQKKDGPWDGSAS